MATTVNDIQSRVAAIVDQDQDTGNISTTDYNLRLNYINRRENTWAEIGTDWQVLYTEYNTLTSSPSGNATISLPADFRKLASFPVITFDGLTTDAFTEIRPEEKKRFGQSDRYVEILGNKQDGYSMIVHPGVSGQHLSSGASIFVPYRKTVASLASPANVVACPNPEYLVSGVIADVWQAREDARFQAQQAEANIILQNMLEFERTHNDASEYRTVKTAEEKRSSFRWGRN